MKGATENKKGSGNYSRIITDFIKLGIPSAINRWNRLAVVAFDPTILRNQPKWVTNLAIGKELSLKVVHKTEDEAVMFDARTLSGESDDPSSYEPFVFNDRDQKVSIVKKLRAYGTGEMELIVKAASSEVSSGSVKVMVFSVKRAS